MMQFDNLEEPPTQGQEHPTPAQLLMRMAISQALMNDQRKIWELYNYDRLTHEEIAIKLKVSRQAVSKRIATIEKRLTKWMEEHQRVHEALTEAEYDVDEGC